MAQITVHVPDEEVLAHIIETRGLVRGQDVEDPKIEMVSLPATANTKFSHVVSVTLTYAFELGEVDRLVKP